MRAEAAPIDILRKRRCRNEQLCGGCTHDRREHRRKDQPCHNGREELARHRKKNRLCCRALKGHLQIDCTDHADKNCSGERDHHPRHRNARRLWQLLRMTDCHKAHEDVRLPEVADAPCHKRDELDKAERTPVHLRQR